MFKTLGNMASLLKQAQKFQGRMTGVQDALEKLRIEGTAGAGMVTVEVTGHQRVVSCRIDKSLIAANDPEMLEELLVAATNNALEKARDAATAEMQKLTGDLEIPGLGEALSKAGLGDVDPTK
jgi:DNA-binding YbaB/EbfC family protein